MEQHTLQWFEEAGCDLYVPASFLAADKVEMSLVCNGCGTRGIGGYLVSDDILGVCVTVSCNIHDWGYELSETDEDEDQCDFYLRENLRRMIYARSRDGKILTWLRLRIADLYFLAVSLTYCAENRRAKTTEELKG